MLSKKAMSSIEARNDGSNREQTYRNLMLETQEAFPCWPARGTILPRQ